MSEDRRISIRLVASIDQAELILEGTDTDQVKAAVLASLRADLLLFSVGRVMFNQHQSKAWFVLRLNANQSS